MKNILANPRKLRHLVALARHGSYVAAARELNLSQPALSRSIQSVEAEIGVPIFIRGRGGVHLTGAGIRVVSAANALLDDMNHLEHALANLGSTPLGNVAFGMGPIPASLLLPELLPAIVDRNEMAMKIAIRPVAALLEQVNMGNLEFCVCAGLVAGRTPNLHQETITILKVTARVREGHALARREGITREEFFSFPMLGGAFEPDSKSFVRIARGVIYDPTVSCDNYHILHEVVLRSNSTCYFPIGMPTPGLVEVRCEPGVFADELPIVLCTLKSSKLTPASTSIAQQIRKLASEYDRRLFDHR